MPDRDGAARHLHAVAVAAGHDDRLLATFPEVVDGALAAGAGWSLRPGGLALTWPVDGIATAVLMIYADRYACIELNLRRTGTTSAMADHLEARLLRALPQSGGTRGQRPNVSLAALTLPDSRAALAEVFAWIGTQTSGPAS